MSNNLIILDGMSGSGKGSRLITLADFLKKDLGKDVFTFNEPFYFRKEIKEFRKNPNRDPREELNLFLKSRKRGLQDYEHLIEKENIAILIDRGYPSTFVYQSLQGISLEEIKAKHSFYPEAGLGLILLCDPEVAIERIYKRNEEKSVPISLDENMEKISKIRDKYIEVAESLSYAHIINTNGRAEAIDLVLRSHVKRHFGVSMNKAVFLDKDGTFVDNSGYPEVIPTDEIFEESYSALRNIQSKGYDLFVVSSQPWVARGRMSSLEVRSVFDSVVDKFAKQGVMIKDYGYCEHNREDNCPDKKPATRLFERMVEKYNIDTGNSYMVGDMDGDILAGQNIGLTTIRLDSKHSKDVVSDYEIKSMKDLFSCLK